MISVYYAYNKQVALFGYTKRNEGLFSILYYLSVMLLSSFVSPKYKKYIVNAILLCGTFQAFYAIFQKYELFGVKVYRHTYKHFDQNLNKVIKNTIIYALGCTTNPNVFGAYMMFCLSYSLGLFIDSKKIVLKVLYGLACALFMFGMMISNCSASAVGLAFVGLYIFIYCIKNKYFKQLLIIALILVLMVILAVKLHKTNLVRDIKIIANQTSEITKGNVDDNFGTNRFYLWKKTLKVIPKYWIHGIGIDNFYYAFDGKPLIYDNQKYDKAHNEYLQTLVTQGAFATVSYLALYGYVVFYGIKNSFKNKEIYLILPIIGYLIQAFFSISVIELAPLFYISLGLCGNRNVESE